MVATLNAARNLDLGAALLGCTFDEFSELALAASPGSDGLTVLPYFEGERTPDLPNARGSVQNATLANFTRENFARSVIEGTLASQVAMLDHLRASDLRIHRLLLIGGAAQNTAVREILGELVDVPVAVPASDEYVTKGAAMQAVAGLDGAFPAWPVAAAELPAVRLEPRIAEQHAAAKIAMGYFAGAPGARTAPLAGAGAGAEPAAASSRSKTGSVG